MTAQILDGTATAAAIKAELTERVAALASRGVTPGLGTLLVGDDPGSRWYVAGKHKDCAEVGITSIRVDLPATAAQSLCLPLTYHRLPGSSPTSTVPRPGTTPCSRSFATRSMSSALIAAAEAAGLTMYLTGTRHFFH